MAALTAELPVSSVEPTLAFEGVPAPLAGALAERGFSGLTTVQKAVLDPAAFGRDLQISSQTGSGKTVALGLVIARALAEPAASRRIRALVIVPTRELAVQVRSELEWLFAGLDGVTVDCVTGGSSVLQEKRRLAKRPIVLVGTPGRLLDHVRNNGFDCEGIETLVLDEADRMLDMGFREELEAILDATPGDRRTHLVSATFPAEIRKLAHKYQKDPLAVQGTRLGAANADIEHVGHLVRLHDRYAAIVNLLLLGEDERTLIFVNTRAQAAALADQLAGDGFAAAPISGELEQNQRTRTLEAFRNGTTGVLVATDVAARGLDIPDVALVIHTDAPFDSESYTHRAGRTGRAGRRGRSVLLSTPMRQKKIEFLLSRAKVKLEWRDVPTADSVAKVLAKRERRKLREGLASGAAPAASDLAFAAKLLEEADPAELVARLIERCRDPRRSAAHAIEPIAPQSERIAAGRADRAEWNNRPDPRSRRGDGQAVPPRARRDVDVGAPVRARRERGEAATADRFEMNWGHRGGATPQRVLAMLCRRGDVRGRDIGSIDIDTFTTSFEISSEASRDFERNAAQPDERDPRLVIRRARADRRRY